MESYNTDFCNFDTLSKYLFIFITNIEPLYLLKESFREANELINDAKLIRLLDEALKLQKKSTNV